MADVIRHEAKNPILTQLISSQLDADRFDYLMRDAYFTGTKYGEFDMERILRTLRVHDDRVVVKESGVYAVENYIMARYHMYWQVYYHPVARSFEFLVHTLFKRLRDLGNLEDPCMIEQFRPIAENVEIPLDVRREELALRPSADAVMNRIVPDYVVGFVYGALVESFSCEQNARMMAMEAATNSAKDMLHELDIMYNRARQAAITQEITEVIAGAKSQKRKKKR